MTLPSNKRAPRESINDGVRMGLIFAGFFSLIAAIQLVVAVIGPGTFGLAAKAWGISTMFYLAAGTLGGAIYGALTPLRDRYFGKVLTAYIILYLVYGGGSVAVLPLFMKDVPPLSLLLKVWAVICLVLAPLYAWRLSD